MYNVEQQKKKREEKKAEEEEEEAEDREEGEEEYIYRQIHIYIQARKAQMCIYIYTYRFPKRSVAKEGFLLVFYRIRLQT